jgi:dUTP pyrophosphatase
MQLVTDTGLGQRTALAWRTAGGAVACSIIADVITLEVRRLRPDAIVPRYMTADAAGMDLAAAIDDPVVIPPGGRSGIGTGLALAIAPGYEGQVRPRSGLARDRGVTVLNAPGTIDADYRGELIVLLVNLGHESVRIEPGQRIAQLVIAKVEQSKIVEVAELASSDRGRGGFGSTGS